MSTATLAGRDAWVVELDDSVAALAWAPDRELLASATLDGAVVLRDGRDGAVTSRPAAHTGEALSLAWSPDGAVLASGGADGCVHLTARDGSLRKVALDGWVQAVRWSCTGTLLAVAAGRSLVLLDSGGQLRRRWDDQPSTVTDVAWSRDGSRVAAAAYGGLRWYATVSTSEIPIRRFDWEGSLLTVEVSPDGRWAASGNQDSSVHIWRLWSGEDAEMTGYPQKVDTLAFDAAGRWMACGGTAEISLWDFSGKGPIGRSPTMLSGHDEQVSVLSFQRRGKLLASAGRDGGIALWDPPRKEPQHRTKLAGRVTSLAWSSDDALLAAADVTGSLRVLHL